MRTSKQIISAKRLIANIGAVFGLFCLSGACVAVSAADLKMGFVNQERILRESGPAKRAQTKLEKEFANRKADLDKLEKQGHDLETTLQKEVVTISEADRNAKEKQLAQITRDFQRIQREFREDVTLRRNEELASLQERANKVITDIAEKEKYDLILQEAVYASPKIDITDKVIKALEK